MKSEESGEIELSGDIAQLDKKFKELTAIMQKGGLSSLQSEVTKQSEELYQRLQASDAMQKKVAQYELNILTGACKRFNREYSGKKEVVEEKKTQNADWQDSALESLLNKSERSARKATSKSSKRKTVKSEPIRQYGLFKGCIESDAKLFSFIFPAMGTMTLAAVLGLYGSLAPNSFRKNVSGPLERGVDIVYGNVTKAAQYEASIKESLDEGFDIKSLWRYITGSHNASYDAGKAHQTMKGKENEAIKVNAQATAKQSLEEIAKNHETPDRKYAVEYREDYLPNEKVTDNYMHLIAKYWDQCKGINPVTNSSLIKSEIIYLEKIGDANPGIKYEKGEKVRVPCIVEQK